MAKRKKKPRMEFWQWSLESQLLSTCIITRDEIAFTRISDKKQSWPWIKHFMMHNNMVLAGIRAKYFYFLVQKIWVYNPVGITPH